MRFMRRRGHTTYAGAMGAKRAYRVPLPALAQWTSSSRQRSRRSRCCFSGQHSAATWVALLLRAGLRKWLERLRKDDFLTDDGMITEKGWELLREHLPKGPFGFGLAVMPDDAPRRASGLTKSV